jgi:4-nitrophenyl phosphatase
MNITAFHNLRGLILDMDGVLWKDNEPIGDLQAIFRTIKNLALIPVLATNNATRTVEEYQQKVKGFGVELEPWQFVNAAHATLSYLKKTYPSSGPIYLIGSDALKRTLEEAGYYHSENDVLAVVAGMDRNITYEKLRDATLLIRSGVPFVGTNPDKSFPTPQGLTPGTGAILAAIQTASDQEPIICGKPSPEMYRVAMERMHTSPAETLVIGDRAETDISGAQAIGCRSALVLSGVTTVEQAHSWIPSPDLIAADLSEVLEKISNAITTAHL